MTGGPIASAREKPAGRTTGGVLGMLYRTPLLLPATLFVVLFVVMILLMGDAASTDLLSQILQTTLPLIMVGLGQTLVILTGGIDLSVGGIMSLASCLIATQMTRDGDVALWIPLVLAIGLAAGCLNGIVILKTRIQPFIVTLATWSILSGISLLILPTQGGAVAPGVVRLAFGSIGPLATEIWLTAGVVLLWLVIRRTGFGVTVYGIGSNEAAAALNGLRTGRTKVLVYGVSGLMAAMAGIYFAALTNSGSSVAGDPFILRSVAAVVLGGTALMGGRGGFIGTLLGALILSFISVIVFFAGAESAWAQLIQGMMLVLAVLVFAAVELLVARRASREV